VRQSIIAGLDEEAYGVIPLDEVVDRKSKNKLYDMWQEDLHLLHEAAHALDPLRSVWAQENDAEVPNLLPGSEAG
jgi:hypothetical protein